MSDRKFFPPVPAGQPLSLEEPYRVIQVRDPAAPEALHTVARVQRMLGQRLALLSAAAFLLGGLFGLALAGALMLWMH